MSISEYFWEFRYESVPFPWVWFYKSCSMDCKTVAVSWDVAKMLYFKKNCFLSVDNNLRNLALG